MKTYDRNNVRPVAKNDKMRQGLLRDRVTMRAVFSRVGARMKIWHEQKFSPEFHDGHFSFYDVFFLLKTEQYIY
jgi:hypothetical protein